MLAGGAATCGPVVVASRVRRARPARAAHACRVARDARAVVRAPLLSRTWHSARAWRAPERRRVVSRVEGSLAVIMDDL